MPQSQPGSLNPRAKITEEQVAAARLRWIPFDRINSAAAMARELGITKQAMLAALHSESWRHVK